MIMLDELKTLPWQAVWEELCNLEYLPNKFGIFAFFFRKMFV
jgi:L-rhamnose isomerase